ncbi:MAG: hypothetical protein KJS68_08895 [Alphaproteobacteria bacterium]|nr:hypothetical protein [Alphaproteobacteria bacterium]MDE2494416.1 hypothetical protein [Alphaproteobacteria bacterium]
MRARLPSQNGPFFKIPQRHRAARETPLLPSGRMPPGAKKTVSMIVPAL